jgi:PmbA protein
MMLTQAKGIMAALSNAGFDQAKVSITETDVNELNIAHNHASLMRTTQNQSLSVLAIQDRREVTASVSSLENAAVEQLIVDLKRDVSTSPQDDAYAVAPNQVGRFEKGPQSVDRAAIAACAKNLLEKRAERYPAFTIEECAIKHTLEKTALVTMQGSELFSSVVGQLWRHADGLQQRRTWQQFV